MTGETEIGISDNLNICNVRLVNPYYIWGYYGESDINIHVKGYPIYNQYIISPEEIFHLIKENLDIDQLIYQINGNYSLVIETSKELFVIVDRVRSIPLFYQIKQSTLIITDILGQNQSYNHQHLDEMSLVEFFLTGFTSGSNTIYKEIFQIEPGQYLHFNKLSGKVTLHTYYRYLHRDNFENSESTLLEQLDTIFIHVFQRLIATTSAQGRTIVVPLSGGLDSRIIVTFLKRLGVKNVICFSFGKKGNLEAEISKSVANSLGYPWYFIEYTKDTVQFMRDERTKGYLQYIHNGVSSPFRSYLYAVYQLKQRGIISEDAVFVPGHTGDMISGKQIPLSYQNNEMNYDKEKAVKDILNKHYSLWPAYTKIPELAEYVHNRVLNQISSLTIIDASTCASAIEYFNFKERQAKIIVNTVRYFEYFGYEWRLPLWDNELMDFYTKVPLSERIDQKLYLQYVNKILFAGPYKKMGTTVCTTEIKPSKNGIKTVEKTNGLFRIILGVKIIINYPYFWMIEFRYPRFHFPFLMIGLYVPSKIITTPFISEILDLTWQTHKLIDINAYHILKQIESLH